MPSPNPTTRRDHAGNATATTLSGSMTNVVLSFTIADATGWPTGGVGPFFVVIDPATASEEKVLCASRSGLTVTVAASGRGVDGTTAVTHSSPTAVVYPVWTAVEADELNAHAAASTAVHGVAGAVVGDSDSQTLTNKTISGASNTFSNIPAAAVTGLAAHLAASAAHGVAGAVVGTTDSQVLTNKTINASSNTLSNIPQAAITNLVTDLAAKATPSDIATHAALTTGVHGVGAGAVVGTTLTQTLTNKTIDGVNNTLSNIPESAVTNLVSDLAAYTNGAWTDVSSSFTLDGLGAWLISSLQARQIGKMVYVAMRFQCNSGPSCLASDINNANGQEVFGVWKNIANLHPILKSTSNDVWVATYSGSTPGVGGGVRFNSSANGLAESARAVYMLSARADIPFNEFVYITTCYPNVA